MNKHELMLSAAKSNIAKSTRRIFFTHCNMPIEDRGYYRADWLHNYGSCILIRLDSRFFILTAKHVIKNSGANLDINSPSYSNESPLMIGSKANEWSNDNLISLLYPRKLWNIGELIQNSASVTEYSDICLIEMFPHFSPWCPDHFLDLDNLFYYYPKCNFFKDQALLISGFPIIKNPYNFEPVGNYSHSTIIQREIMPGRCIFLDGEPVIDLKHPGIRPEKQKHHHLNGMSGGSVFNVIETGEEPHWCGMITSGGNGIVRFIPADYLLEPIANYQKASSSIIDPMGTIEPKQSGLDRMMKDSYG